MVEQRADARWALNLPAVFVTRSWGRLPCVIKDFCAGGALIGFREPDAALSHGLKRGDGLVIQLRVEVPGQGGLQELRCRVAHRTPGMVGLAFITPSTETLTALNRQARVPEFTLSVSDAVRRVLDDLYTHAARFYQESFTEFEDNAERRLLAAAEVARSHTEQRLLIDMLAAFRKQQPRIRQRYHQTLQAGISQFNAGAIAENANDVSQLALIDKTEFEEWLIMRVMVSRVETRCRSELNTLQLRLDALTQAPPGRQFNPFACAFLCQAFHQALMLIKPSLAMEKIFYKAFEESVLKGLQGMYAQLNQTLIRHKVLPDLVPLAGLDDIPAELDAVEEEVAPEPEIKAPAKAAGKPASPGQQLPLPRTVDQLLAQLGRPVPPLEPARELGFRPLTQALRALWQQLAGLEGAGKVTTPSLADLEALLAGVGRPDSRPLPERMASLRQRAIAHSVLSAGYMVETVFTFLLTHNRLDNQAVSRFRRLALPVLRLLVQDAGVLDKPDHPVRAVLNALFTLAGDEEILSGEDQRTLVAVVDRIAAASQPTQQTFAAELGELNEMLARQELTCRLSLERLARQAAGERRVSQARARVQELLDSRLAGHTVPQAVLSLLDAGWQEQLVLTLVRQGEDSPSWRAYWQVLDDLLTVARNADHRVDWRGLLATIKAGLDPVATTHGRQQQKALAELKQLVAHANAPAKEELPMASLSPKKAEAVADVETRWLERWLERARRLNRGDVVELKHKGAESQRLHLAWVADDHSQFVFADHRGQQLQDFSLRELAALLRNGHALIADRLNLPPMDAAVESVVRDLYEQLIWQATHDNLTGLVNRQEFTRVVGLALARSKRTRARHVLAQINIDQFRLLNRQAGLEAGDQLLREVAHLLAKPLKSQSTLARLGNDTFGLLLEDCDLGEAQQLLSMRLSELAATRFGVGGQSLSLSASAGLTDITFTSESCNAVMQAAESACEVAKEAGGNRIEVYHPDNAELQRRDGVLAWVATLNQALEAERLQLRCQRIRAVDPKRASEELPHYEILLGMHDEKGQALPPDAFVQAAERYNRMQAVDRWVIDNSLRWLAENPEKFARLGMVSINLSGHSLNDAHLLEYVIERLAFWKVEPQKICFEVTETIAIANLSDAADLIRELKKCGCRFALDDFGVGQSSYHYLKHLPVDYVKIDGAFIRGLGQNASDDLIVRSINEMAHVMGRETIAEYVENDDILKHLAEIGVDYAQGYGIERPRWLASL